MLSCLYKEGFALRMINKDSSKYIQDDQRVHKTERTECQTIRLFAILGVLTIIFVLLIRLVQNGTSGHTQRLPSNVLDSAESNKK